MAIEFVANHNEHERQAIISDVESELENLREASSQEEARMIMQEINNHLSNMDKMMKAGEE